MGGRTGASGALGTTEGVCGRVATAPSATAGEGPGLQQEQYHIVGEPAARVDGWGKVTGRAQYADDLAVAGMLYAGCARSRFPHALVEVDASSVADMPGVACVLTAADFPKPQSMLDWYYCTDHPRYCGDVIAVIAAAAPGLLEDALRALKVTYKKLPGVYTVEEALAQDAPQVREKGVGLTGGVPDPDKRGNVFLESHHPLRKGDVDLGFAEADVVMERTFRTGYVEHAAIEPESVLALPDGPEGVLIRSCSQQGHMPQEFVADCLQVPMNRVRAVQCAVGGSFGGKFETVGLMCGRAALVLRRTGRPCKMTFSREDSILESPKRHPFVTTVKVGATADGRITAYQSAQVENAGAYNNQAPWMNIRARAHSAGPYRIPNVRTDTYGVFTNNPVPGAFRGYSSPQVIFCNEMAMAELADELHMSVLDLKRKNLLRRGDRTATGQLLVHQTLLPQMMEDVVRDTGYEAKKAAWAHDAGTWRRGIGLVTSYRGAALGGEGVDASGAAMCGLPDGSFTLRAALMEIGQGLMTVYAQIAAEASGIALEDIEVAPVDTRAIPDSGLTVASRCTAQGGQSVRLAGESIRQMMLETGRELLGAGPDEELEVRDSKVFRAADPGRSVTAAQVFTTRKYAGLPMAAYRWYVPRPLENDDATGQGEAFTTYAYGVSVAEVRVNAHTGLVKVDRVTAYHDVGHALNPALVRGQIAGGIVMGMGFGSMEEVRMDRGKTDDVNLDAYRVPTALDAPQMVIKAYECDDDEGTYGAKCIAEAGCEMIGAAVALAVRDAIRRPVRALPVRPERVLELLGGEGA